MSALMPGTVLKPAKHGFVIDLQDGARRVQVRVFEFEEQQVPGVADVAARCEMPVTIDEGHACARLRAAMELMREAAFGGMRNAEGGVRNGEGGVRNGEGGMRNEGGAS